MQYCYTLWLYDKTKSDDRSKWLKVGVYANKESAEFEGKEYLISQSNSDIAYTIITEALIDLTSLIHTDKKIKEALNG